MMEGDMMETNEERYAGAYAVNWRLDALKASALHLFDLVRAHPRAPGSSEARCVLEKIGCAPKQIFADPPAALAVVPVGRAKQIMAEVSGETGVSVEDILSHSFVEKVVDARHEAMWRVKRETQWSFVRIAREFQKSDHSTVSNAIKRVDRMRAERADV